MKIIYLLAIMICLSGCGKFISSLAHPNKKRSSWVMKNGKHKRHKVPRPKDL